MQSAGTQAFVVVRCSWDVSFEGDGRRSARVARFKACRLLAALALRPIWLLLKNRAPFCGCPYEKSPASGDL